MHYSHSLTVPFQDVDAAGKVFFAHLFRYAHEAYERFMEHIGQPLAGWIDGAEHLLPISHAQCDYHLPLQLNQTISIELALARLGNSAFTLRYRFLGKDGQCHATAETVHVLVAAREHASTPIPRHLRLALESYLDT